MICNGLPVCNPLAFLSSSVVDFCCVTVSAVARVMTSAMQTWTASYSTEIEAKRLEDKSAVRPRAIRIA